MKPTERIAAITCSAVAIALCAAHAEEFRVTEFGARADGITTNTAAIQRAIDAAAAAGGGDVTFERGTYLSGAVFLKSNVRFHLDEGVVLRAIQDDALYPERPTRVAGLEMVWPTALVNVYQQTNVTVGGKGMIDGNGEYWWHKFWGEDGKGGMLKEYQARGLRWAVDYDCKRVRALAVYDSSNVQIQGVTIQRSGFWSLTLTYSHDVTVDGVVIRANIGGFGPSSDGIDIDSSHHVLVQNCDIDCNDDNICLKAGRDWDGLRVNRPTENITIRNCITRSGHGMLTLGSETSGGIRNVQVSGLRAFGTSNGIRFKSARVRGGVVENIALSDIVMDSVENPFHFELNWYPAYSYPTIPADVDTNAMPAHWNVLTRRVEPAERGIPEFKNIVISNVTATGAAQAIYANAYPEKPMSAVRFEDVHVTARTPGQITNAKDWIMKNVVITAPSSATVNVRSSENVELPRIVVDAAAAGAKMETPATSPFKLGLGNTAEGDGKAGD
jgi:polygalacturonase